MCHHSCELCPRGRSLYGYAIRQPPDGAGLHVAECGRPGLSEGEGPHFIIHPPVVNHNGEVLFGRNKDERQRPDLCMHDAGCADFVEWKDHRGGVDANAQDPRFSREPGV